MDKLNTLKIQTPEGVVFTLTLAGPVTRFVAWFVDLLVIWMLLRIALMIADRLSLISPDFAQGLSFILFFLITLGYSMFFEWGWRGQTIGKRLMRLRVMDRYGLRLQFPQVALRNLLRAVDMLPLFYLFGGIVMLLNRHAQRLGDIAANTIVIREPKLSEPDLGQIGINKYNSFRDYPHIGARLRQHVTPIEATVALQALLRRDRLDPLARVRLFSEIAAHFRSLAEFPADSVEGLSDEQYIRNAVEILFDRRK